MRWSSLVVFVVALLAFGCASPTGTPPPTLQPTVVEPTSTPTLGRPHKSSGLMPVTWEPLSHSAVPRPSGTIIPVSVNEDPPEPAATEASEATPAGTSAKPLEIESVDLHYYLCQKTCWDSYGDASYWAFRSFLVLMRLKNVSTDLTLTGGDREDEGWSPTTWFITDGANERIDDDAWQYPWWSQRVGRSRPDLPSEAIGEWVWLAVPLSAGEWVSAVEYEDDWGNLYRQDFPKPEVGQFNYVECGDPKEGSC